MKTPVLILLCLMKCLTACSPTQLVPDPVLVEVPGERVLVKCQDLEPIAPTARPAGAVTYGEAIGLWADDRAALATVNGKLGACEEFSRER